MFEDIDDQKKAIEISAESPDRTLVYAVWARNPALGVQPARAWEILSSRYSDEARFLLLHAYEELVGTRSDDWTPTSFLAKVVRVLDNAGGKLNPEVRDLLAVAEDDLHPLSEADAARLDRIRARVSSKGKPDAEASRKRLSRVSTDLVRELHDRTQGGKSIGRTSGSMPVASAGSEWKTALAKAKGAKSPYSATAKVSSGDVVVHPKFGDGIVLSVEPGRANILFESGARKLVVG
ncbi:MAG: hypothetical protein JST00_20780 [Deltaproteobacteria bacterium]|nr:hypothetical protein [Deltaproteobacteria bacterium]